MIHSKLISGSFDVIESLDYEPVLTWTHETLRRFMNKNGFEYGLRPDHYAYTRGRLDICVMPDDYLEWIDKYRTAGYRIFYQDETWVFDNIAQCRIWKPKVIVD